MQAIAMDISLYPTRSMGTFSLPYLSLLSPTTETNKTNKSNSNKGDSEQESSSRLLQETLFK